MSTQPPSTSNNRDSGVTAGAILSVLAGGWMLLGLSWMNGADWGHMHQGGFMDTMHPWVWHHSMMSSFVAPIGWPWPGAVAAIAVLAGGVMLFLSPAQKNVWAVIILAGSALIAFTSMGGLPPGILGIVGGLVALFSGERSETAPAERSETSREEQA